MSWLIYGMKIFLFRNSGFRLTARDLNGLKEFCIFEVKFDIRSWFSSHLGISAPKNNLLLARSLLVSGDRISLAALNKLKGHFWYLWEKLIGFSVFDDSIYVQYMYFGHSSFGFIVQWVIGPRCGILHQEIGA